MTPNDLTIETVDRDGALRESMDAVGGDTRADLLRRAALATGGLVSGGAALAAMSGVAAAQTDRDVDILNFALLLELLEARFYDQAFENIAMTGEIRQFTFTVRAHERVHVKFLRDALGTKAIREPTFDFGATVTNLNQFLTTAVTLEDTGVKAYKGQAPRIRSGQVLRAALSIHSVEARHASWVRTLTPGADVIPESTEAPLSMRQVLAAVTATGFVTSPLPD